MPRAVAVGLPETNRYLDLRDAAGLDTLGGCDDSVIKGNVESVDFLGGATITARA